MKSICVYLRLSAVALFFLQAVFAIDGTVYNQTTGKPAADATVTLYKLGQAGPEALETVHTDANGRFEIKAGLPPGAFACTFTTPLAAGGRKNFSVPPSGSLYAVLPSFLNR